jgi:N-acetylglucosaminyldiphosphoundecaprenol N-acetyl-beta-D-mannosaminyltransferase
VNNKELALILGKTSGQGMSEILTEIFDEKQPDRQNRCFMALHISFLLNLENSRYLEALMQSDLYIDGVAVAIAAKRLGITNIKIAPTTDLAPAIFAKKSEFGIPLRCGLIGGSQNLVEKTELILKNRFNAEVVYAINGYPETWSKGQWLLISSKVDILFVGMGVPQESIFVVENLNGFNAKNIITCGGLFKFLTGEEVRAPKYIRRLNCEWLWRLTQDPKRLFQRYFFGTISLVRILLSK